MPIKKIIMAEETLRKLEQQDSPMVVVAIPAGTNPSASGDFVLHEISEKYPGVVMPTTTGATISFVAQEGAKEHMELKKIKLHLGISPSMDFEWGKGKNEKEKI